MKVCSNKTIKFDGLEIDSMRNFDMLSYFPSFESYYHINKQQKLSQQNKRLKCCMQT